MNPTEEIIPGQRWISDTESDLGLGIITSADQRMVTIEFPASGEQRRYATSNAPLSRVRLNVGEVAQSGQDWELRVEKVYEQDGLLIYEGIRSDTDERARLPESGLSNFTQIADAKSRFLNGQIDSNKWFEIRLATRERLENVQASYGYGLSGVRISLIPHQLFIAQEVGSRFAPRALLADEVGLGKTIEACLILHKQLLTGRAQRALIIVPDALLHQWLIELLRRFNLRFKLFDEDRCSSAQGPDDSVNPFDTEQLILTPLSLFKSEKRQREALAANWELVVVDEAHHIQWRENNPSTEYLFLAGLAKASPGLLLLTATPEQLGEEGHFARLRLLDPDRFSSFSKFMQEQLEYAEVSAVIDDIISTPDNLATSTLTRIEHLVGDVASVDAHHEERLDLVRKLIDRHGPSRVLFRNTRSNMKGFPRRIPSAEPRIPPREYESEASMLSTEQALYPEMKAAEEWTSFDPRVGYLVELLQYLRPKKILVICARAATAVALDKTLRIDHGIHAAMFHEQMSIVARDRAAHFFADHDGARILLCSEIGSEGRNFQFAHHLVLFDLPLYPDLLEQRIGRLDRIGQTEDIRLHIPYLTRSGQAVMYRWYQDGLDAFSRTCQVGQNVFEETEVDLRHALRQPESTDKLVERTRALYEKKLEILERGRDRLLEISSFDQSKADQIIDSVTKIEASLPVMDYLERVFDIYGVEFEDKNENMFIVRPSDHMHTAHFPHLRPDGMTVSFDRAVALAHEDVEYLTWEHPLTHGAMDLVLTGDDGKAVVIGVESGLLPRGSLLVETVHVAEIVAPNAPELRRFAGTTTHRFLRDESGRDLSKLAGSRKLLNRARDIDPALIRRVIQAKHREVLSANELNERDAREAFRKTIDRAKEKLINEVQAELQRLDYLQSVNASVRKEELDLIEQQLESSLYSFDSTQPRLDAIRVIITL